jgi:DNA-binding CsgD family transcriptional regulator
VDEADALELAIETAHDIAGGTLDHRAFLERLLQHFPTEGNVGLSVWRGPDELSLAPHFVVTAGCAIPSPEWSQRAAPYAATHPGFAGLRRMGTSAAVRVSDEVPLRRFWGTDSWEAMHSQFEGRYPAGVLLHADSSSLTFLGLHLKRRDFTDEEMLWLTRLQQPVAAAYRYRAALDRAADRITALYSEAADPRAAQETGRAADAPTRREAEVLGLMAAGWTNLQIAGRLHITERTVRKHLSAVYDKAHLPGRAAAATWWFRHQDDYLAR